MTIVFKKTSLLLADIVCFIVAYAMAMIVRFDGQPLSDFQHLFLNTLALVVITKIIFFYAFGLYKQLWRFASINELIIIVMANTLASLVIVITNSVMVLGIPRTVSFVSYVLSVVLTGGIRFSYRVYKKSAHRFSFKKLDDKTRVMIIGAGEAASLLLKEYQNVSHNSYLPVIILDDDPNKANKALHGITIKQGIDQLAEFSKKYDINEIVIAMPSVKKSRIAEIYKLAQTTDCTIKIIPSVYDIVDGKINTSQIREVEIQDLLGRDEVQLDISSIKAFLTHETVLVTGAGGSIGSELCRQIILYDIKQLIILDNYENSLFALQQEFNHNHPQLKLEVIIANIRDKERIENLFEQYKPSIVFHAAAHKHVPLMEGNPSEAVKNNILGTYNVAQAAHNHKAKRFILISSDKAVNPTNVMGATKRWAELIIQSIDKISETQYAAVRFGNVLGSNGSVVPLFKQQIARGGPVLVTHPDITRFFMTIPEACRLVLQAGSLAEGGEIFILDMGEPVKIVDLAKELIKLSGFVPDEEIKIEYTGLRPGEKLYEELLLAEEGIQATKQEGIFVAKPSDITYEDMVMHIETIENRENTNEDIKKLLSQLVPELTNV